MLGLRPGVSIAVVVWACGSSKKPPEPEQGSQTEKPVAVAALDAAVASSPAKASSTASVRAGLVKTMLKAPTKQTLQAQLAAIEQLGKLPDDKPGTVFELAKLVEGDPPPHPRVAGAGAEEAYAMHLALLRNAIRALGELADASALQMLLALPYRFPELMIEIRVAVAALGAAPLDEYRKVLTNDQRDVAELFRTKHLDLYCGDANDRPIDRCERVSAREFYAAIMLGDSRSPKAVPDLLKVLDTSPLPVYFIADEPSPNTQHDAVIDALRKIGAPEAAARLRAIWSSPSTNLTLRALAIDAYSYVARDTTAVPALAVLWADNAGDDFVRQAAATAYARLSREGKDIPELVKLSKKYVDASAKKAREAKQLERGKLAADAALDKARKESDAINRKLELAATNSKLSVKELEALTAKAAKVQKAFVDARQKHREKIVPFRNAEAAAAAYLGYARMFQTHGARIDAVLRCKDDDKCYAGLLSLDASTAAQQLATYVPDAPKWTAAEQAAIVDAYVDRAMIELAKHRPAAPDVVEALLAKVGSSSKSIRDSVMLALPKVAPAPCPKCVAAFDAVLSTTGANPDLAAAEADLRVLRNYYRAAK